MHADDRHERTASISNVGEWDLDLTTGKLHLDPVLKAILGYQDHEVRNQLEDWCRLGHPDDAATVLEKARAHITGKTLCYECEHRMLHRDGSIRWFLTRGSVVRDAEGRAVSMSGTDTDITELKQREEAPLQAEAINQRIFESTADCVKILGIDGRLLHVNRGCLRLTGLEDASALLGRPLVELFEREACTAAEEAFRAARKGGAGRFQGWLPTASGSRKWLDTVVTPITDGTGDVTELLAVSRDLTERRREEAFRTAQHEMLEMIAAGRALSDVLDCVVRFVEEQSDGMLCSILLLDEDGKTARHGSAPSLPAEYVREIGRLTIGPGVGSCGTAMHLGTRIIVEDILTDRLWKDYRDAAARAGLRSCWSMPISSSQRVLGSFAMYYREPRRPRAEELRLIESAADIARLAIEQHRAQQALRQSEARTRAILRAIPDMMFLIGVDGTYLDYHARDASRLLAPPAVFLGKNVRDIMPPDLAEAFMQAFKRVNATDEPENVEYSLGSDEDERFYEASIVACDGDKILSIVRDVTDRKRAELEAAAQRRDLAHLGRVSVLGGLTGALAHELSQPLTAAISNAQAARHLLDRDPPDLQELRSALDDLILDNRRAGAVVDRLRALLSKEDTPVEPVDLNDVVREVVELANSEVLSRRIQVKSALASGIPPVSGNRVQLQQVVLNLLLNACEAMSQTPTADRHLDLETQAKDEFVELVVSDHGPGIPADQLDRVFEPFVTSREKTLGLGLAISRSIVIAHHGSIRAENNAEGGTTFRCFLPVGMS